MIVRFVGRERSPAIGGELLEIEHRRPWSIANPANSPGGEEESQPSSAASLRRRGRTYSRDCTGAHNRRRPEKMLAEMLRTFK
jgi:hypothetical protein